MTDNGWISTSKRLPKADRRGYSDEVLALTRSGEYYLGYYQPATDYSDEYWLLGSGWMADMEIVRYWQTLPLPPPEMNDEAA